MRQQVFILLLPFSYYPRSFSDLGPSFDAGGLQAGNEWVKNEWLDSLRFFGSTGEPWNDKAWLWLYKVSGQKPIPHHQLFKGY